MEHLNLAQSDLIEMQLAVALTGRVEDIVVDMFGDGANTVYTADALHETCAVPRCIVIDDDVGAMEVDALGEDICCEEDIEIVELSLVVGIEILTYSLKQLATIGSSDDEHIIAVDTLLEVFDRLDGLGEDDELALGIAVGLEKLVFEQLIELGELRIVLIGDTFPLRAKPFESRVIGSQIFDKVGFEIVSFECVVFGIPLSFDVQPILNLIVGEAGLNERIYIEIGRNENLVALEHIDHILIGLLKTIQRRFEGIETAFESFDHSYFADGSQAATDGHGIFIETFSGFRLEKLNGPIAYILEIVDERVHGMVEEISESLVKLVSAFQGAFDFREAVDILIIPLDTLDIRSCTSDRDRLNDAITDTICQLLKISGL